MHVVCVRSGGPYIEYLHILTVSTGTELESNLSHLREQNVAGKELPGTYTGCRLSFLAAPMNPL